MVVRVKQDLLFVRIICYIGVDVDHSNRLALGFAHTLKVLELLKKNSRP